MNMYRHRYMYAGVVYLTDKNACDEGRSTVSITMVIGDLIGAVIGIKVAIAF